MPQSYVGELESELPEVDAFLGTSDYAKIEDVLAGFGLGQTVKKPKRGLPIVDGEPMASGSVHVKILQRQLRLFGVAHDRLLQTLNVSVKTSTVTLSPGSLLSSTLSSSSTTNLDEAITPKEVTLHFAVLWS